MWFFPVKGKQKNLERSEAFHRFRMQCFARSELYDKMIL